MDDFRAISRCIFQPASFKRFSIYFRLKSRKCISFNFKRFFISDVKSLKKVENKQKRLKTAEKRVSTCVWVLAATESWSNTQQFQMCWANSCGYKDNYRVRPKDIYHIIYLSSLSWNLSKNDKCINIFRIEYMSLEKSKKNIIQTIRAIYPL